MGAPETMPRNYGDGFGKRLYTLRKERKLPLRRVALGANCAYSLMWKIEKENYCPTLPVVERLARFFGCDPAWLIYGNEGFNGYTYGWKRA